MRDIVQKVKLDIVCEILDNQRVPITASKRKKGIYPYYGANGLQDYVDDYIFDDELILLAEDGGNFNSNTKPIAYRVSGKCWVNNHAHVLKAKDNNDIDFLCYALMFYDVSSLIKGATRKKLTQKDMREMLIPLYSQQEQKSIALKIGRIFNLIEKRKQQLEKLDMLVKSQFIEMFGDVILNSMGWDKYAWQEVLTIKNGRNQKAVEDINGSYPIYGSGGEMGRANDYICRENSVVIGRKGNINKPLFVTTKFWNVDTAFGLESGDTLTPEYLFTFCLLYDFGQHNKAVTIPSLTKADLLKIQMPIPPKELQEQFSHFVVQTDKSKSTIKKSLDKLETLKKALMQKYFG